MHAAAGDLSFLNPVRNRMNKILGEKCKTYHFSSQHEQASAKLALKQADHIFVVIMAHGGSSYILGGEYIRRSTGETLAAQNLLTREEISHFENKIIYCMSCNSNDLAQAALDAGAIAFVGFDHIPFVHFDQDGNPIRNTILTQHTQTLIANATKATLENFLTGKSSLRDSIEFLKLWADYHALRFIREYTAVKQRKEIAALFRQMRDGVKYHGETDVRFVIHSPLPINVN
ncbi:hypothetical protein Ga0100231_017970 [Opitutaceae bacterium TAV4]|nr:hypothetical protein Ga0100231_017970 [Opitutaceae bacterium TAV4]RRK00023.1 hypothetical protein Ga0100230_018650 [Opitutaceae bacterium TAV3]